MCMNFKKIVNKPLPVRCPKTTLCDNNAHKATCHIYDQSYHQAANRDMDVPRETPTFFALPLDLRNVIWGVHRKLVFEERCRLLEELLKQARDHCHVGVHSSYSPVCMPRHIVWVHIDGPNGKIYCLGTRDHYRYGEGWAQIRDYELYDRGYLEMRMDDSGGTWAPLHLPHDMKIEYSGRPKNTEYYK